MSEALRITSIFKASSLDESITGFPTFELSELDTAGEPEFALPQNLRLGHLAERIVGSLIKLSSAYQVLHENVQIRKDKDTIGELDFIIQQVATQKLIHLEVAYKFYLLDPNISENLLENWIGPNRNDSLVQKLKKLRSRQFPLLFHEATALSLPSLALSEVKQALCLLASLYVPYQYAPLLPHEYQKHIKGYYLSFARFAELHTPSKRYHIPDKRNWGMNPNQHTSWQSFNEITERIKVSLAQQRAVLCWEVDTDQFSEYFIVWW